MTTEPGPDPAKQDFVPATARKLLFEVLQPGPVDLSAALLVLTNLLTIVVAIVQKWDVRDLMWVYWGQSMIIGFFSLLRMLDLRAFSAGGNKGDGRPEWMENVGQVFVAGFFWFHFCFSHLLLAGFLAREKHPLLVDNLSGTIVLLLLFLLNHGFSIVYNRREDRERTPSLGALMLFPYARVIPMQLTVLVARLLSWDDGWKLILFLGLKVIADVVMHMVEHSEAMTGSHLARRASRY